MLASLGCGNPTAVADLHEGVTESDCVACLKRAGVDAARVEFTHEVAKGLHGQSCRPSGPSLGRTLAVPLSLTGRLRSGRGEVFCGRPQPLSH